MPVIILAAVFDLIRAFFQFFWFFGPALAGVYCTVKVSSWVGSLWGATDAACVAGATYLGFASFAVAAAFGTIMAMATGLLGWLTLGAILMATNGRIFRENFLWFGGGLAVSQIPFVSTLPAFSFTLWRLHHTQIKKEQAALKKWHKDNDAAQLQERNQRAAQLMQAQAMQQRERDAEWSDQMAQQEIVDEDAREQDEIEQQGAENEEEVSEEEILEQEVVGTVYPQHQVAVPATATRTSSAEEHMPTTHEYGPRKTPPLLTDLPQYRATPPPTHVSPQMPPPLGTSGAMPPPPPPMIGEMPPPTAEMLRYMEATKRTTQPPPPPVKYANISGMKVRPVASLDVRSVEQVAKRNNVFIVHTLAEEEEVQHHNANSNVSDKATYADDMDIMLALEPSVSASSITPGKKSKLWTADGFILGGGHISEAGGSDRGTVAHGIKRRGGGESSIEEIDVAVGRKTKMHDDIYNRFGTFGMNEVVVNDSEVFGYFQSGEKDSEGRFWAYDAGMKNEYERSQKRKSGPEAKTFQGNLSKYRNKFALARERGIPTYIRTPDNEMYECVDVNDDGSLKIVGALKPEDVAHGRAGLTTKKRKEVGEKLLEKKIFRNESAQAEAEKIIRSLD
jgi:hypothetical protein